MKSRFVPIVACGLAWLSLAASPTSAAGRAPVTVFAAASLAGPFREIVRDFQRAEPGTEVRLNLAGSQQLVAQVRQGAHADVLALADERWMAVADSSGLLAAAPEVFARNALTVIVPRANRAGIAQLQDLTRPGLKLVLGADAVPVGHYSRTLLARLASRAGFPRDYARRVLANVVSEEDDVRGVVGKVQLGEADAGIVYRSEVTPSLRRSVREIGVPDSVNVAARYPIAVLAGARERGAAERFAAWVTSARGQAVLARHHMQSPHSAR